MRLRPHHLFCAPGFKGSGGDGYTENLRWIADKFWEEPFAPVEVIDGPDDICAVCTHFKDGICCWGEVGEEAIRAQDTALLKALGLSHGQTTSIAEVRRLFAVNPESADEMRKHCVKCRRVDRCTFMKDML